MRAGQVIQLSIQRMVCTSCGAEANASCNCGKPYICKAQKVREAIEADPDKSNHQIARETGAHRKQVQRERAKLGGDMSPPIESEAQTESDTPEEIWYRGLTYRAGEAIAGATVSNWRNSYGDYTKFKVTSELVTLAEQAAEAWTKLAEHLREMRQ